MIVKYKNMKQRFKKFSIKWCGKSDRKSLIIANSNEYNSKNRKKRYNKNTIGYCSSPENEIQDEHITEVHNGITKITTQSG